ncbi:MAG: ABC transporter permease subunit [Anaerolineae bacterium]|nr:ABC transporter permease subunit [Anaerolineae bacterium]MCO5193254.1 ABC transporter permease subunit [Anaerolineae bacterium]MCO5198200.1 ABC transporter permease subunit [Anaerolineae bacterium]MCO5205506.1 ABC transporter permease subunit [Anaerolineae bacterium]
MQSTTSRFGGSAFRNLNLRRYWLDNVRRSWLQTIWLLILLLVTIWFAIGQLQEHFASTIIIFVVWAASVIWTAVSDVRRSHRPMTLWLKTNLYGSLSNVVLSLLLALILAFIIIGFFDWAVVRASFSTNPTVSKIQLERKSVDGKEGAAWGAVIDNFRNLMVFRWPTDQDWRLFAILLWNVILLIPSLYVFRKEVFRRSRIRRVLTILWILTPFVVFFLLRGFKSDGLFGFLAGPIPYLNPDIAWGGLLLTLIIAVFAIVASFPLGLLLALGRRSKITGIPAWLTYGALGLIALYFFVTRSIPALAEAQTTGAQLIALWPLLLLLIAYLFQRYYQGNVVALASTVYIEVIRGVPLITVLFMSIILFPILLPPGTEILSTWRVMVAAALFAAAYLAENVRGGLQSLNKGQYEAADAVGLNTYKKYRLIVLPQALRAVIPAIVGQFISLFKDTTLVAIVGLIELLGVANLISAQPDWLGVRRAPYVFIAVIYFVGSALMAWYSRRLERRMGVGER